MMINKIQKILYGCGCLLLLLGCEEEERKDPALLTVGVNPADTVGSRKIVQQKKRHIARLVASPKEADFGEILIFSEANQRFGIVNNSKEEVKIRTVELFGMTSAYEMRNNCQQGTTLAMNAHCTIDVTYKPMDDTRHTAEIVVTYHTGKPLHIALSARGMVEPELPIDPAYIDALQVMGMRQNSGMQIHQLDDEPSASGRHIEFWPYQHYPEGQYPRSVSTLPIDRSRIITEDRYIPAVLENTINSELNEGRAIAVVERTVYGSDGRLSLIPAGSRIVGRYSSLSQQGNSRLAVVWQRVIRPDGASIRLDAEGADPMGRSGLIGDVDSRFFQKYGSSILTSLISILPEYFIGDEQTSTTSGDNITSSSSGQSRAVEQFSKDMSFLAKRIIEENLSLEPIITVPQGTRLLIIPSQDLYLAHPDEITTVDHYLDAGDKEEKEKASSVHIPSHATPAGEATIQDTRPTLVKRSTLYRAH